MRRSTVAAVAATLILVAVAGRAPALGAEPEDSVNIFHEALLATMKEGRNLGESGRYARIEPVIHRLFDVASMTRLTVGATWASLSPAQRQRVTAAFGRLHLCHLCRSLRQLLGPENGGGRTAAVWLGCHC
jgi:phospholipid transport system substrate-binding protein